MQAKTIAPSKLPARNRDSGLGRAGRQLLPLRHPADRRTLGFLVLLNLLFLAQWTGWCRFWPLLPLTGALAFVACVAKHNHIHCRTFSRRGWNRAFDFFLGLCTGQSTTAIIPVHNERHHAQSHTEEDCVRSSLVQFRWNWLNLVVFPFVAVRAVYQKKPADLERWRQSNSPLYRRAWQERWVLRLFILLLLACDWKATLIYMGLPWLFGHWGIVTINLLQHQDCDPASPYDHSRNLTGKLLNWVCLNNGLHTAHHLRPALHWSRLPEFHEREVVPQMRPDLNHDSLLRLMWGRFLWPADRMKGA